MNNPVHNARNIMPQKPKNYYSLQRIVQITRPLFRISLFSYQTTFAIWTLQGKTNISTSKIGANIRSFTDRYRFAIVH